MGRWNRPHSMAWEYTDYVGAGGIAMRNDMWGLKERG